MWSCFSESTFIWSVTLEVMNRTIVHEPVDTSVFPPLIFFHQMGVACNRNWLPFLDSIGIFSYFVVHGVRYQVWRLRAHHNNPGYLLCELNLVVKCSFGYCLTNQSTALGKVLLCFTAHHKPLKWFISTTFKVAKILLFFSFAEE